MVGEWLVRDGMVRDWLVMDWQVGDWLVRGWLVRDWLVRNWCRNLLRRRGGRAVRATTVGVSGERQRQGVGEEVGWE